MKKKKGNSVRSKEIARDTFFNKCNAYQAAKRKANMFDNNKYGEHVDTDKGDK